ncbi:MAG TPA: hypothetical protein VKJ01_00255, partial [Candidatus Solibacter sp.]|nr:hypothetical protein [Candidatus Solibacter sp.]
ERDLAKIRSASLAWQTEEQVYRDYFDEDFEDEPELDRQFQSYHVFFLEPDGDEFRFETEGPNLDLPEDPEEEDWNGTEVPGEGVIGCSAAVCLAAPVAVVDFSEHSRYEDGSSSGPDIDQCIVSGKSGERVTPEDYYRSLLSPEAFQKIETLRAKIVAVLQKHGLEVMPLGRGYSFPFGYRPRIHVTNFSGAAMVERRDCRTSAQSSNSLDCFTSASVVGGSIRPPNSRSTTADLGFFGSARGSDATFAQPTTAETPPLW